MLKQRRFRADMRILAHFVWVAAALLILAVTGGGLLTLVRDSSPAESQELKSVRRKAREMEGLVSAAPAAVDPAKLDRLFGRGPSAGAVASAEGGFEDEAASLPRLTGIASVVAADGHVRYHATLDGRSVREKEQFDGYTVRKISSEGVLLVGGGKEWMLRAPETGVTLRQN